MALTGSAFVWETGCFLRGRKLIFITIAPEVHDFSHDLKILGARMATDQQILRRQLTNFFRHWDLCILEKTNLRPYWVTEVSFI